MADDLEFWRKSSSDVHHCARLKTYLDGSSELMVCSKPVFIEAGYESAAKFNHSNRCSNITRTVARDAADKAGASEASADRARRRAATKVRDIALSNRFRWFVTLTLDRERIDRYDVGVITKKLNQVMDNLVRRRGLAYVLVPERHKDGAIHFHGFFNDALEARDSGTVSLPGQKAPRRPRSARQRAKWLEDGGKPVYNLPGWSWGFTTAIELYGEYDRAVSYVCKYIGKELAPSPNGDGLEPQKIGGRWYYSGGALGRPQVTYAELEFRQAEQEPGAYRFDLPQAGISFVQFQFQAKGGENSGEPVEKVAGGQSQVPLVGAVRQPPLLGLRPGLRGAQGGGP